MKNIKNIQAQIFSLILLMVLWAFSSSLCQAQEIVIPKNSVWKYSDSGQDLGTSWYLSSYSDASWLSGPGILGYGGGDEGTVISYGSDSGNKHTTTYFRNHFTISRVADIKSLIVRLMRDDGAIVYLNGNQLFSSNMPEGSNFQTLAIEGVGDDDERTYFEFSLSSKYLVEGENLLAVEVHQITTSSSDLSFDLELETLESIFKNVRINEVLPTNFSHYLDPDFNQFQDWIEIYNPQQSSFSIGGYYLTDNLKIPDKWQIPAGTEISGNSYLIIFADGLNQDLHSSFRLAREGERIGLFTPDMELVDTLSYPPMFSNVSYGIMPDGETRGFFGDPTPSGENTGGSVSAIPVSEPTFSKDAGFFTSSITVLLSTLEPLGTIRYTTDGSDPSKLSARYVAPFTVAQSSVVKARVYVPDAMPSKIITKSYFINKDHDLPVISIGTNSDFIDDAEVGIYRADRLLERKEWERPGTLEFFESDGSLGFQINIDYRLFGRGAIYFPQKSLAIFARNTDGYDGLDYELFPGTPVTHFQSFILRSSSDDWRNTMFRDGMIHSLLKGQMDLEYQDYRPTVLYINGKYMGIHNIRDKLNEDYLSTHKAVDPANVDLLFIDNDFSPPRIEVKSGDDQAYWAMWNFIVDNDMSDPVNYQTAAGLIDIDNYQDYCIVEIVSGNRSWLHNRRVWRPRTPDGKFRYMLFDLDYGYMYLTQRVLVYFNDKDNIFKNLMANPSFKAGFFQKLAAFSQTTFAISRVVHFVDSLANIIESEIPDHTSKWGSTYSNIFTNKSEWETRVEVMRDYARRRPPIHDGYVQSFLNQVGDSKFSFSVNPPESGEIWVCNKMITDNSFTGDFYNNQQIAISGHPATGFSLEKWEGISGSESLIITRGSSWKYSDLGQDLGTGWRNPVYDDASWPAATGPLGFGRSYVKSVISYGNDEDHKYTTTYFRKTFNVSDPSIFKTLLIRLLYDDGAVVYLNGTEKFRVNMPSGTILSSTFANGPMWGELEGKYYDFELNPSDLLIGNNTIAVEVHQDTFVSSDLGFDIEMGGESSIGKSFETIYHNVSKDLQISAQFRPNNESDVVISEVFYRPSTEQGGDNAEFIELYNKGTTSFDLTGYVFSAGVDFEFPSNTILEAGQHLIVTSQASKYTQTGSQVFEWDSGFLSNIGESITIIKGQDEILDSFTFDISSPWPQSKSGYSIEFYDDNKDNSIGSSWILSSQLGGSPGTINGTGKYSKLRINEFVGLPGGSGYFSGQDWIEIKNLSIEAIDIGGMYISDDQLNPLKYQIPSNSPDLTSIPAGGYIVLIADGLTNISPLNLPFKLKSIGGAVVLSESVGETARIIDQVTYTYLSSGKSIGRTPDGTGNFVQQIGLTPTGENLNFSENIIVPYEIEPGDIFPVIVRITDENGNINRQINSILTLTSSAGTIYPNKIYIRNGVGTLSVTVNSSNDFEIGVAGYNYSRKIGVDPDRPKVTLTGPISDSVFLVAGVDYILTDSLVINSGAVLFAGPDVRILVDEKINIWSKGLMVFEGSLAQPIVFMPRNKTKPWGGIKVQNTPDVNLFKWVIFTQGGADSTRAQAHSLTQPIIYAQSTILEADEIFMVDNIGKAMFVLYSEARINNSVFSRCDMGPELSSSWTEIRNSWFIDLPDADRTQIDDDNDGLYYHKILSPDSPPHILDNCVVSGTEDDGVDVSETNLVITNCIFNRNLEKGISCGWRSNIEVDRSLFYNNYIGLSSTFWTPVNVTHCTFFNNTYAFQSSWGGGGTVYNSILSDHRVYYADDSTDAWYFDHCLSDSDPDLIGENNMFGDPGFVNGGAKNFHLTAGSPAINAGNPELPRDADGTLADLGIFPYDGGFQGILVISEIYYNPPSLQGADENFEFLEIINPGPDLIDISGFRLIDGIDFSFPSGTSISPGEALVVVSDAFTYRDLGAQVFEWDSGKLSNSGERIALIDANGRIVDEVTYLDQAPWPLLADGDGYSMELPDVFSINSVGSNWVASPRWGGSPGELNLTPDYSKISLNEVMAFDGADTDELYLGSTSWLEVYNSGLNTVDLGGCKFSINDGSEFVIPVGSSHETSVQQNGYLVFFFDSDENSGANHIPLKWNNLTDNVTLSRSVGQAWSQLAGITINGGSSSWGRYPDGGSSFYEFRISSPGYGNSLGSPDLITMKTVMSGERTPIILRKKNLDILEMTQRDVSVQVISGSADFNDTSFPMIDGVGSVVAKVTSSSDFKIEVGDWQDTVGVRVDEKRHIFHIDKYILFDQVWTPEHDYYIDRDLDLRPGVTITILPGTRVFLISRASIVVSGSMKVLGTQSNPVLFAPQIWADPWDQIVFNPFSGESTFQYAIFIGGGGDDDGNGHTDSQAVIRSNGSIVNMSNCFILDNPGKGIYIDNGILNLSNSLISRSDAGVEGLDAYLNINNSYFTYIPGEDALDDAGENDAVFSAGISTSGQTSIITNCVMAYIRDDAIDLYDGATTFVSGGHIQKVGDKVASVTGSELEISYTLIQKSVEGLVAKERALINADHLTLFQNETSLHAYTNDANEGHGRIEIENSIISGSVGADLSIADGSSILLSYTLSDKTLHSGTGNILGNPLFVNPDGGDFELHHASPAIDAGNPSSPLDADGSRTDLGAFIGKSAPASPFVINEIMYAPKSGEGHAEFIEIINSGFQSIDITDYYFETGVVFEFPPGTIISGGEYLIVTKQSSVYQGNGYEVFQWSSGDLSNSGEEIRLVNKEGELVDVLSYGNSGSWPITPNGMGPSLELKGASRDNSLAENWRSSYIQGGTPGMENSSPSQDGVIINEFMARNWSSIQDDTGEYVDWVELYNAKDNFVQLNGLFLSKYDTDLLYYEISGNDDDLLLGPGEFILFWLDDLTNKGTFHTNFELSGSGGFLALSRSSGGITTILDSVYYSAMSADISYGRFPDAGGDWVRFDHPSPGSSNNVGASKISGLYINEILARNSSVFLNDIGEYDDWIELYNSTSEPIDVGGLYFSDATSDPLKYRISTSSSQETTVESHGYLMLFASAKPDEGIRHLDFQLAGNGEHVSIAQLYLGQTVIIDSMTYPGLSTDKTWGRTNDGGPYWNVFETPTPDATNGTSSVEDFETISSKLLIYPNPATDRVYVSFINNEPFDYRIEAISPLSQTISLLAEGSNNPAYSRVSYSFDVHELGTDAGAFVFLRVQINEQYYVRKILVIMK